MKFIYNLLLGITFGFGLILSNVFQPGNIIAFLDWNKDWDPSFLYALIGMMMVSLLFLLLTKKINVIDATIFYRSEATSLDTKMVFGSILFGVGWSMSGLCVSTAAINLAFGEWQTVLFFIFMMLGFYGPKFFKKITL